MERARKRIRIGTAILVLVLVAAGARSLCWRSVFVGEETVWTGGPDAYYHARRAELAAAGQTLRNDLWTNFPEGDRVHWPGGYDRALGVVLSLASMRALTFVPLFLGVAAVLAFAFFAARVAPDAWFPAALAYALLPAAVYPSALGAIDHHCLEELLFCAALALFSSGSAATILAGCLLLLVSPALVPMFPVPIVVIAGALLFARGGSTRRASATAIACALVIPVAGYRYLTDPWISGIDEAAPLIRSGHDIFKAVVWLSPGFLFLPFAAARWARSRRELPSSSSFIATIVLLPLALIESRFTLYLAIPCALAIGEGWRVAAARWPKPIVVALFVAVLLPPLRGVNEMRTWPEDPTPSLRRAMRALNRVTDWAGDPLKPETLPSHGVVAAWDLGNAILEFGRRPVLANAFHTSPQGRDAAHRILFSAPRDATSLADRLHATTLFLTDLASTGYAKEYRKPDQPIPYESLFGQLYLLQNPSLGWKRVYGSEEAFGFEGRIVPGIQIWTREGIPPAD